MATLFFGVDGPTLSLREDLTILDTDAPRILAYLMASSYGQVTENVQSTVPDPSWVPDPGETEADRPLITDPSWTPDAPLIPDPNWVASEEQPEAPLIPDPNWPSEAPMVPDVSWTPRPAQTEADNPGLPVQAWVTRPATPEETAENYARAILNQLLAETVNWEKAQAAQQAANGVAPIVPMT